MIIAIPEVLREMLGPEGARVVTLRSRADVIEIAASRRTPVPAMGAREIGTAFTFDKPFSIAGGFQMVPTPRR